MKAEGEFGFSGRCVELLWGQSERTEEKGEREEGEAGEKQEEVAAGLHEGTLGRLLQVCKPSARFDKKKGCPIRPLFCGFWGCFWR